MAKARQVFSYGRLAAQHVDPEEGGHPPDAATSEAMSRCVSMLGELIRSLQAVEERPGYVPEADRPRYELRDLQTTGILWRRLGVEGAANRHRVLGAGRPC